jgi:hypothetical protein
MVKQTSASRGMAKTVGRTSHHKELNRILREHPGRAPTTPPHPPSYCQLLPFNALTMVDISAIADDGTSERVRADLLSLSYFGRIDRHIGTIARVTG